MFTKFKVRSTQEEQLDDFELGGQEINDALVNIARVNNFLGGNLISINGFRKIVASGKLQERKGSPLVVRDIGCGGGDGLRALAAWANKNALKIRWQGHDANQNVVEFARRHSTSFPEIEYKKEDILANDYHFKGVDVVCCSLFLHHFTDEQQLALLQKCFDDGVQAVLINDLHRHWLAYYLFRILCLLLRAPEITREDGLISILRGFKREDLHNLARKLRIKDYLVKWCWAFRYRVILFGNPAQFV